MMFPMWATQGWLQPFRFIEVPDERTKILDTNLLQFVQQSRQSK
jgi:hypothetical protein